MRNIAYIELQEINTSALLEVLNREKIRGHLVPHDLFDEKRLSDWIEQKNTVNKSKGCKVKGIIINDSVAGWCGIQLENDAYEIAIVLDQRYWGLGGRVFKDLMKWTAELGHEVVVLHLLNTRPEYKFLRKMARRVYESTIFEQKYISYELEVPHA